MSLRSLSHTPTKPLKLLEIVTSLAHYIHYYSWVLLVICLIVIVTDQSSLDHYLGPVKLTAAMQASNTTITSAAPTDFSQWMRTQKRDFLDQLERAQRQATDSSTGPPLGLEHDWIIVNGNEAGGKFKGLHSQTSHKPSAHRSRILLTDLDSLASSIGYAYLADHQQRSSTRPAQPTSDSNSEPPARITRYIPLLLTARADLVLRPENELALLQQAPSLSPPYSDTLLSLEDIDSRTTRKLGSLGVRFALVDHNVLLPMFHPEPESTAQEDSTWDSYVSAVIDHHADEQRHLGANPRYMKVVGSCASLVVDHFLGPTAQTTTTTTTTTTSTSRLTVPQEVANLLLSAILIDTGLKPLDKGGKASSTDLQSVALLVPFSSFGPLTGSEQSSQAKAGASDSGASTTNVASAIPNEPNSDSDPASTRLQLLHWHSILQSRKSSVSHLSGRDLLRRDYKEYSEHVVVASQEDPNSDSVTVNVRYGLATVPLSLRTWANRPTDGWIALREQCRAWAKERQLAFVGVLTSYAESAPGRDASGPSTGGGGDNGIRRREVLLLLTPEFNPGSGAAQLGRRLELVRAQLEQDESLRFEPWLARQRVMDGHEQGEQEQQERERERDELVELDQDQTWSVWQQGKSCYPAAARRDLSPFFLAVLLFSSSLFDELFELTRPSVGNTKATRKQVAPALRALLDSTPTSPKTTTTTTTEQGVSEPVPN